MPPVSPSIRCRTSAPAGERPSGVEGNERVCIENLLCSQALSPHGDTEDPKVRQEIAKGEQRIVEERARRTTPVAWIGQEPLETLAITVFCCGTWTAERVSRHSQRRTRRV